MRSEAGASVPISSGFLVEDDFLLGVKAAVGAGESMNCLSSSIFSK